MAISTKDTIISETKNTKDIDAVVDNAQHLELPASGGNEVDEREYLPFSWDRHLILNLVALYCTFFATVWGTGMPGGSIAYIQLEYPLTAAATTNWVSAVAGLMQCIISIFIGDLSDIFGRQQFLLVGMAAGAVGMLLGGFAHNVNEIIGGQVLNGIGVSVGYLSIPLLAEIIPKRYRGPVVGGAALLAGFVGIGAGVMQGALMKYKVMGANRGWRVTFYMGGGFYILAAVMSLLFYRPKERPNPKGLSVVARLLKIDWVGIFLSTLGLLLFLLGLQYGGNPYPWTSPRVLSMIIVGVFLVLCCIIWEWKFVKDGMIPRSLFRHRNFAIAIGLNFIEGMVGFACQAFIPQMLLKFITQDLILVPTYSIPGNCCTVIGAMGGGLITAKMRETKWVAIAGVSCLVICVATLPAMSPTASLAAFFIPSLVGMLGIGTLGGVISTIASLCTPDEYIAASISVGQALRGLGGSIAIVAFSSIYSAKLSTILPTEEAAAVIGAGLPPSSVEPLLLAAASNNATAMAQVPGVTQQILQVLSSASAEAYAECFRYIWYSTIPFAIVTLGLSLLLKSTRDQMTYVVSAAVKNGVTYKAEQEAMAAVEKVAAA
ncbi:hypothetical protein SBRCBS47491_000672 [Sporothrix bragantina]|uniref:Major facilitator superfamily (MFS) profile domain-containing protein n=1 Tax=Sporothrix bragantina TaxID=671064 RepID=A0ABP0AS94_9PEZI